MNLLRQRAKRRQSAELPPSIDGEPPRPDDHDGVMEHANKYAGGKALIVLGGHSGVNWESVRDEIKPDVILGGNGVNRSIYALDYWMCAENMRVSNTMASQGDKRGMEFMEMFHRDAGAKVKLISHWSWNLLKDKKNCISIRRRGYEVGEWPSDFSLRKYGEGFMNGWVFKEPRAITTVTRVGTVGAQLLHMAGILGVSEVHTIGFDLIQRDENTHHWYKYPKYQVDRFRRNGMFVNYRGVNTQLIWIGTAQFLKYMEPFFERDGLKWVDHSDGLLKLEGLKCAL